MSGDPELEAWESGDMATIRAFYKTQIKQIEATIQARGKRDPERNKNFQDRKVLLYKLENLSDLTHTAPEGELKRLAQYGAW